MQMNPALEIAAKPFLLVEFMQHWRCSVHIGVGVGIGVGIYDCHSKWELFRPRFRYRPPLRISCRVLKRFLRPASIYWSVRKSC